MFTWDGVHLINSQAVNKKMEKKKPKLKQYQFYRCFYPQVVSAQAKRLLPKDKIFFLFFTFYRKKTKETDVGLNFGGGVDVNEHIFRCHVSESVLAVKT